MNNSPPRGWVPHHARPVAGYHTHLPASGQGPGHPRPSGHSMNNSPPRGWVPHHARPVAGYHTHLPASGQGPGDHRPAGHSMNKSHHPASGQGPGHTLTNAHNRAGGLLTAGCCGAIGALQTAYKATCIVFQGTHPFHSQVN